NVSLFAYRLLAGRAHIHVDFHAARHFDDLRGFPGHFGSPLHTDEFPPSPLNYRGMKSSPVNSFVFETFGSCCAAARFSVWRVGGSKQNRIKGFHSRLTGPGWALFTAARSDK